MSNFIVSINAKETTKAIKHLAYIAKVSNIKKEDLPEARESFLQVVQTLRHSLKLTIAKGKDDATFT